MVDSRVREGGRAAGCDSPKSQRRRLVQVDSAQIWRVGSSCTHLVEAEVMRRQRRWETLDTATGRRHEEGCMHPTRWKSTVPAFVSTPDGPELGTSPGHLGTWAPGHLRRVCT